MHVAKAAQLKMAFWGSRPTNNAPPPPATSHPWPTTRSSLLRTNGRTEHAYRCDACRLKLSAAVNVHDLALEYVLHHLRVTRACVFTIANIIRVGNK